MSKSIEFSEIFKAQCMDVDIFWGSKMPMIAMEECGELIQAISKMGRGKNGAKQMLIDEIGDVYICLRAIQKHYDITDESIEARLTEKRAYVPES